MTPEAPRARTRRPRGLPLLLLAVLATACSERDASPAGDDHAPLAIRLLRDVERARLPTAADAERASRAPILWNFADAATPDTAGWRTGPGVPDIARRGERLVGRVVETPGLVWTSRDPAAERDTHERGLVEAVEVRVRADAGSRLAVLLSDETVPPLEALAARWDGLSERVTGTLAAGDALEIVTVPVPFELHTDDVRSIVLAPTDAPGAQFRLASVRLVVSAAERAVPRPGIGWHDLGSIYEETLVLGPDDAASFDVVVPAGARLLTSLGTPSLGPITFELLVTPSGDGTRATRPVLRRRHTVTTSGRWEPVTFDLAEVAGACTLALSLAPGAAADAVGYWGNPTIRRADAARAFLGDGPPAEAPPQGVILVMADALRTDHLDLYGYERTTAPRLSRLAREGATFTRCMAQGTWTKVATASLLTALYPPTLGVAEPTDRVPANATTLAEAFQRAGHATLSLSSVFFSGKHTNLHQGFDTVHEMESLPRISSKTSREYVDALLPWLERHRDQPFFVFLHVFDPHDPYEPDPPYDATFTDPGRRAAHERARTAARARIDDPMLKRFGMPGREHLRAAGVDPDAWAAHERDWYDASILGMDAEIGRLLDALERLGLRERTLVVFTSDHGEEFFEHGRLFHGQSVYGELAHVPLVFARPGLVEGDGVVVDEPVAHVDVMPTIIELAGLPPVDGLQGQSLAPLFTARAEGRWRPAPVVTVKAATTDPLAPPPRELEAFAIVHDGWKLVHNTRRVDDRPEFELFDVERDPLDRHDVAAEHPDVVERLATMLTDWRAQTAAARLPSDAEAAEDYSPEQLERLRALGYVK